MTQGWIICLPMQETQEMLVWSLGQEDPLEKGMSIHSSILARIILWTEDAGGLQSIGSQRGRHDWMTECAHTHTLKTVRSSQCTLIACFLPTLYLELQASLAERPPNTVIWRWQKLFFFLSLVNNPEMSGLDWKGSFSFVSPPYTRATFLKLPLFKDRFLYIQCAEDQYFGLDSTDHAFVFHNNVKLWQAFLGVYL